jgi:hypothetical protein
MISSVFFPLRGLSHYLCLLLFISFILITQFSYSRDQQIWSNYGIMPVITRSKARMLRSSINEGHDIQFTSDISINETYCSIHEHYPSDNASPASIHELPSRVLLSDSPSFSYNSVIYTEPSSMASSVVTSSLEATPSNFSNFQNSEILNCSSTRLLLCHNLPNHYLETMESDCEDQGTSSSPASNGPDITQLFASLSAQMTYQTTSLQDKLSTDFSNVVQANDVFKKEVRAELDELRLLIAQQGIKSETSVASNSSPPSVPVMSLPTIPCSNSDTSGNNMSIPVQSISPISTSPPLPSVDVQAQMMMLLTESFSKLSSVLVDKNTDSKSDWPKFSGDPKKFRAWYMSIMAQLSLPSWQDLYDGATNDIVKTTTNYVLNGKLYSKLLLSLEGQPLQDVITRPHLRADGIGLLRELSQTYRPKNVPV